MNEFLNGFLNEFFNQPLALKCSGVNGGLETIQFDLACPEHHQILQGHIKCFGAWPLDIVS